MANARSHFEIIEFEVQKVKERFRVFNSTLSLSFSSNSASMVYIILRTLCQKGATSGWADQNLSTRRIYWKQSRRKD